MKIKNGTCKQKYTSLGLNNVVSAYIHLPLIYPVKSTYKITVLGSVKNILKGENIVPARNYYYVSTIFTCRVSRKDFFFRLPCTIAYFEGPVRTGTLSLVCELNTGISFRLYWRCSDCLRSPFQVVFWFTVTVFDTVFWNFIGLCF